MLAESIFLLARPLDSNIYWFWSLKKRKSELHKKKRKVQFPVNLGYMLKLNTCERYFVNWSFFYELKAPTNFYKKGTETRRLKENVFHICLKQWRKKTNMPGINIINVRFLSGSSAISYWKDHRIIFHSRSTIPNTL